MGQRRAVRVVASLVVVAATAASAAVLTAAPAGAASTVKGISAKDAKAAAETYADVVYASYDDSVKSATTMKAAITAFLPNPNDATLAAAKQAWLTARNDYLPTEAFRFYDGPIDNPKNGPEGRINAWPMDEAYVDYVVGSPSAGIINNTAKYPAITTEVLTETNEKGEFVDPWKTPLRIYFSDTGVLIRSAGPNRRFDDSSVLEADDFIRSN